MFAFVPILVTVAMQTTRIKAIMTAYSTALAASSEETKFLSDLKALDINMIDDLPLLGNSDFAAGEGGYPHRHESDSQLG